MNALDILLVATVIFAFLFAIAAFLLAYKEKKNWGWFLGASAFCIYILILSNGAATIW